MGRVITETRTVSDDGTYQFKYAYNASNQLVQTTYPGNFIVKYTYDKYGNKIQTTANDKIVYQVDGYDGLETKTSFLNKYTTTFTLDSRGFKSDIVLKNGSTVLDQFKMNYEGATGNLLSRTRNSLSEETFGYDNLDRLVSVKVGTKETMHIKYAENGNITSKTGIGQYYYDAERPHAVSSVDNTDNLISTQDCTTQFNDLNKISSLQEKGKVMTIDYGPDLERCFSILKQDNTILRKVTYMDDYEKVVANGVTREFYYLDGDVIVIRQNGTVHAYQSFKDNLGSILSVIDENGSKVFSAEYDAWGKQTVSVNTIGLIRGYGSHEMLNEFCLINMNGRVYDPVLGRFLSPDKYIQEGDNSQNYNSYSYCLNNPLKYTDPSGNVFVLDDFIAITAMGAIMGTMNAVMSDKPIWRGALIGGISAAATYGIGSVFGPAGSFGREMLRAGAHGLSSGVLNVLNGDNFWNGLISGAASSGMGSFAQSSNWNSYLLMASTTAAGGAIAWATGGDFLQGALNGLQIGAFNFAEHDGYDGNGGPGYVKRLPDGTLEAQEPLQEVVCKGIKIRPILNVPHEKPLVAVYPEFDILFFVRAAISEGFSSLLSSIFKNTEKSFFENTRYTGKVKRQMLNNDYHSFPESVTAFEKNGQVIQFIGGDGIKRSKLTIPGWYRGKKGVFEFIKEPNGDINHRLFRPFK